MGLNAHHKQISHYTRHKCLYIRKLFQNPHVIFLQLSPEVPFKKKHFSIYGLRHRSDGSLLFVQSRHHAGRRAHGPGEAFQNAPCTLLLLRTDKRQERDVKSNSGGSHLYYASLTRINSHTF